MTTVPAADPLSAVPRVRVPAWAWAVAVLSLMLMYVVLQENGAVFAQTAEVIHEFTHDGRHALGVPCH
ncbi:CbtB domain-containing protein [Actinopolyspora mortivallis]|uniref:CbtB-domain containing protein n=1 Tax=Actinopolyspora mortivallis TaxID=33906 RepID=A0A2T0GWT7_ACTMO|nr:CbtB-domain containing protein [Actinopolyspora mortivallis]PRW63578.1 CbtB-domain containing protein [Actinopolyspora mortivallis]